ncbi:uncharacterized protein M437DRAFT_67892 [Aureobasidium melanogenum CBS 110374]|uniref:Uncharacterized protein n=1 Tax=Aureobasidium melanogenum (strain CBS 110374) TaxID=1043003 RepID=A0A074VNP4_AURM1|nr:uncharacterized protein M437DRAFT_67892 [Aureobasidium melanogenum CBS 110374]KEQ60719.1 hypothetical protein M437DRAFT_67892 [Aureobasidium melanogenum CBS 110374]
MPFGYSVTSQNLKHGSRASNAGCKGPGVSTRSTWVVFFVHIFFRICCLIAGSRRLSKTQDPGAMSCTALSRHSNKMCRGRLTDKQRLVGIVMEGEVEAVECM